MTVGFIGLGLMGSGMAANLQKAGHAVVVHDLTRQAASRHLENGASWAETPRALAEACEVVFTSLPTPADVEAVCHGETGLAAGLRPGAAWFDLTTNAVDVVRRLHAELAGRGVDFLDAPVSGGPAGAASGTLALWVGGDEKAFERCRKLLDAIGDQVLYIGAIGAGTIAKLVHNCAHAAVGTVLGEVFTMGVKAGVDPLTLWAAVRQGALGRNRTFDIFGNRFLPGQFDPPSFALRLLHKDTMLALQLGRDVSVPMRLCNLVGQELTEAMNRGWGGRDSHSYLALQNERAGIPPIAVPREKLKAVTDKG
jgi:3-hydroxyisobutyrate dehydrogenase